VSDPIITLTTDFGTADHLVGSMKGVILNINPTVRIVDINHQIAPYDVLDGALCITQVAQYYPPRIVHVVVVDPGVGTERRPLLVSVDKQYFIGPDNGVFSMIFERDSCQVRHITAEHYFLNPISPTFHGRDVFAPTAAWLTKTGQIEAFGEVITDYVRFKLPKAKAAGQALKGVVLRVDAFGNLITNFTASDLPATATASGELKLSINGKEIRKLVRTFGHGAVGEPVAILGSGGFLEVAVNRGNAARAFGANRGAEVTLELA